MTIEADLKARCDFWNQVLREPGHVIFTHADDFQRVHDWVRDGGMDSFYRVVTSMNQLVPKSGTVLVADVGGWDLL